MTKKKNKELSVGVFRVIYGILFAALVIPLLAGLSSVCYYNFIYQNANVNKAVMALVLVAIVLVNIAVLYGVAKLYKGILKTPIAYTTVSGMVLAAGLLIARIIYAVKLSGIDSDLNPTDYVNTRACGNDLFTAVVFALAYTVIFAVISKTVKEKK